MSSLAKSVSLGAEETSHLVNHTAATWDLTSGISTNKVLAQLPTQLRAESAPLPAVRAIYHTTPEPRRARTNCALCARERENTVCVCVCVCH